ncbi:MAG: hypothetical protein WEB58_12750 [Planctomycetaceae bacterium]
MTEQWFEFCGKAVDNGTAWLLETYDGEGALAALKDDVRLEGGVTRIRRGARVKVLRGPRGGYPVSLQTVADGCPCGRSCCIGFVVVCCGTGEVVNSAAGIWNECSQEPATVQPQNKI